MPDRLCLAAAGYDRSAHRRGDPEWLAAAWTRARVIPVSPEATVPVQRGDGAVRLALADAAEVDSAGPRRFLGLVDDLPYFAVTVPAGEGWANLRQVGAAVDDLQAGLLTAAVALEQWHGRHTHCPRCGAPTVEAQAGWIRRCPADDSDHFPRTDPAVIMVVHDGGDLCLLGRGREWNPGRFSTLAGFVEPGESLEAAVAREVHEEVDVEVRDVRYVASQPWPFPSSLMVGFSARADDGPIHLDPVEMAEAGWFTRAEVERARAWTDTRGDPDPGARLRGISPVLSISRYLIDHWLDGTL